MSTEESQIPGLNTAMAWSITGIFATIVGIIAIMIDLATRWGGPLVLEAHTATVVWAFAFALARVANLVVDRFIEKHS